MSCAVTAASVSRSRPSGDERFHTDVGKARERVLEQLWRGENPCGDRTFSFSDASTATARFAFRSGRVDR